MSKVYPVPADFAAKANITKAEYDDGELELKLDNGFELKFDKNFNLAGLDR